MYDAPWFLYADPEDDEPTPPPEDPDCGGGDGCGRR